MYEPLLSVYYVVLTHSVSFIGSYPSVHILAPMSLLRYLCTLIAHQYVNEAFQIV
jgi:hypothetical protein